MVGMNRFEPSNIPNEVGSSVDMKIVFRQPSSWLTHFLKKFRFLEKSESPSVARFFTVQLITGDIVFFQINARQYI